LVRLLHIGRAGKFMWTKRVKTEIMNVKFRLQVHQRDAGNNEFDTGIVIKLING
jgi:hypothetical protein